MFPRFVSKFGIYNTLASKAHFAHVRTARGGTALYHGSCIDRTHKPHTLDPTSEVPFSIIQVNNFSTFLPFRWFFFVSLPFWWFFYQQLFKFFRLFGKVFCKMYSYVYEQLNKKTVKLSQRTKTFTIVEDDVYQLPPSSPIWIIWREHWGYLIPRS